MFHPASLVDSSVHSPATIEMVDIKMSRTLIEYAVDRVIETVDYAVGKPSGSKRVRRSDATHRNFLNFVTSILYKAEVKVPVLLVALVYIDRVRPHLQVAFEEWAFERVFLGALIAANKFCNDSTIKNIHWAMCTGVFGDSDVNRIEYEFLLVLDYELNFQESDILAHHAAIMSLLYPCPSHSHSPSRARTRTRTRRVSYIAAAEHSSWSESESELEEEEEEEEEDATSSRSISPMPATPELQIYEVPIYTGDFTVGANEDTRRVSSRPTCRAAHQSPHPSRYAPRKDLSTSHVDHRLSRPSLHL